MVAQSARPCRVQGLCFGAYAEASPEVDALVDFAARSAKTDQWRAAGAISPDSFVACHKFRSRKLLGVSAARAHAKLLLTRVRLLDAPRLAVPRVRFGHEVHEDFTGFNNLDCESYMNISQGPPGSLDALDGMADGGF